MQTNLITPSKEEPIDQPRALGSPLKAVLLGLAIDVGGTLVVGVVLGIVYAISLAGTGMNETEIQQALSSIPVDSWVSIIGLIAGVGLSILGGFICSRISRRSDYKLGFILGTISAAVSLLLSFATYPILIGVVLTCLTFASVLLGAKLGLKKNQGND